ncbi:phosphatidate cytidylyltransferase [Halanaerobaculum tunisiense]
MLTERILSGLIGIPLLILIFKIGGWAVLGLNLVIVTLGLQEYYKLVANKGVTPSRGLGILLGGLLSIICYLDLGLANLFTLLVLGLIIILLKQILVKLDQSVILATATTYFGVLYIAGLFSHLSLLYNLEAGALLVWLPIVATWLTDTGAYFTGLNWGQHALAPQISPNKTIEGALGGILGSVLGTLIFSLYFNLGYLEAVILGILIAVVAQLGDLAASAFKRDAQIKDSGDLIPGHGGLLDRIDSLLFALPIVYYYLQVFVL